MELETARWSYIVKNASANDWEEMCNVKIPIPSADVQQDIVNIYNAYIERKEINERLKTQIKDICSILIKGSLEEAKK